MINQEVGSDYDIILCSALPIFVHIREKCMLYSHAPFWELDSATFITSHTPELSQQQVLLLEVELRLKPTSW